MGCGVGVTKGRGVGVLSSTGSAFLGDFSGETEGLDLLLERFFLGAGVGDFLALAFVFWDFFDLGVGLLFGVGAGVSSSSVSSLSESVLVFFFD